MANNEYAQYSVSDFDHFDCLKISKSFYLLLIFVLRGYIVWLISISNLRDKTSFIQWFFPEPQSFYLSLLSGTLGLFVGLLLLLRKPAAPKWTENLWPFARIMLVTAVLFDLIVSIIAFQFNFINSLNWLLGHTVVVFFGVFICYKSRRLTINLHEFPAPKSD